MQFHYYLLIALMLIVVLVLGIIILLPSEPQVRISNEFPTIVQPAPVPVPTIESIATPTRRTPFVRRTPTQAEIPAAAANTPIIVAPETSANINLMPQTQGKTVSGPDQPHTTTPQ